jgi:hypothetical protein
MPAFQEVFPLRCLTRIGLIYDALDINMDTNKN